TGTSYYFHSVNLNGGSTVTFTNSEHTDVYIDDELDVSGGGLVNANANPTKLGFWACGTSSSAGWTLSGGSGAYYSVYAPNHDITVSGNGDIYGALVSKALTFSGGSKLHYDKALMRAPGVKLSVVTGSWAELTVR